MVSHVSIDRFLGTVRRASGAREGLGRGPMRRGLYVPAIAALVVACHHSSTGPNPDTTGALIVTLDEPPGTTSLAAVGGPNQYAVFVAGGVDTLIGLAAGSYTLSDVQATANDAIVTPFYAPTIIGSPVNVANADTAHMGATFAVLPGTGQLWIGSSGGSPTVAGYNSTQLTSGTAAGTSLSVGGTYVVLDAASNLWVADSAGNRILEYPAAALAASGTPTASVTLTSGGLSGPDGITFDRLGDLWVANAANNTVAEFTAAQLAAGGAQTPAKTLRTAQLSKPGRLSFDAYGNLWVPNFGANTVVAFSPDTLALSATTPTIPPTLTLSVNGGSLSGPTGVAFDQQGDLWVTNRTGNTLVEFTNGQQTASGSPVPTITFSVPPANGALTALAFDNSGDLWALSASSSTVVEYSGPQLSAAAATSPAYTGPVAAGAVSLAFDPPPNGLPIVGPETSRIRGTQTVRSGTIRMPRGMQAIR
jgi:sugar lactone lactonase YvrE